MILRSRLLVTMDGGEPIEDGAVLVRGSEIVDVGSFRTLRAKYFSEGIVDLGEHVLLPGLINAHCHLDYTHLRGTIAPQKSFSRWIQQINSMKRSFGDEDVLRSISAGFSELLRGGVTTVLNVEAFPELMWRVPPPPIRTWWFYEMIDIRHREATKEVVAGALLFLEKELQEAGGYGLSPHAPYTASEELYRLANACAEKLGIPVTTHVAESAEEDAMFRLAEGPMADFFRGLGRPMADCNGHSSFGNIARRGLIQPYWILVHLNELNADDFALIEQDESLRNLNIVHCPQSHRFFSHRPFQSERLRQLGANISLGTDSLASGTSLSMFREMRSFHHTDPSLRPEEVLAMATRNPARALRMAGRLGEVRAGAFADLIALPFNGSVGNVYEAILDHRNSVSWMMINGRIVD
jgi:aminodeoxyfutalosine deaminase